MSRLLFISSILLFGVAALLTFLGHQGAALLDFKIIFLILFAAIGFYIFEIIKK